MKTSRKRRGSRLHRFAIFILGAILTLLVLWLLGFVEKDIGKIKGPEYEDYEEQFLDESLKNRVESLEDQRVDLRNKIAGLNERQKILRQSTNESRTTMNQLIEVHRLSLEKGVTPSPDEQTALAEIEHLFLTKQKEFQEANEQVATLSSDLRNTDEQLGRTKKQIRGQSEPAREAYDEARKKHRIKVAALKMAFLIPFLLLAAFLVLKRRDSEYASIFYAVLFAAFWRVGIVMHQYFPREWFRYLAIGAGILVVLVFMIQVIRAMTSQKSDALLKQYKESYNQGRCPMCAFPIRRGPFKHAVWTGKGPKVSTAAQVDDDGDGDKPYTCPGCGEHLFEKCAECDAVRHSLLPYCDACGAEKSIGD